jgi:CII-binding regulator of phage lambda lysogenization HflD
MEAAQQDRDRAEASARKRNTEVLLEIEKDYANKIADIEKSKNKQITDLQNAAAKKRAELTKSASDKEQSIIKQSIDRLRNAFSSKLSFNLADSFDLTAFTSSLSIKTAEGWTTAFSTAAKSGTDKLLADLKTKLQGAKDLQENAAKLAGMGYSQTFIEEVVKNGPEAGNKIAAALQAASPDATKELQDLYGQVEKISETGLDQLAATMNSGGKLATQELMTAYSQVAIDLKQSLAEVDSELNQSLADANAAYSEAMAEAQANRTEKMAAAMSDLQEALAAAKLRFDDALYDATRDLQRSLASAQKDYQDAIDEINIATQKKLAELKLKLAEVATAMRDLGASQAAYAAMQKAPVYTPIVAASLPKTDSSSNAGGSTTNITTNITGVNLTSPSETASAVTNGIKYGTAVTVNTTTLAGIKKASATTSSVNTQTGVSNKIKAMGMNIL